MGIAPVNLKVLGNVSFIVLGVVIASFGELQFVMIGFLFQVAGIVFEATRLVMVERILSSKEFKMDPLVSLYYYAPACAVMNTMVLIFTELPQLTMSDINRVGGLTLIANAGVAFLLNVSVVFLVCSAIIPEIVRANRNRRLARLRPSSLLSPVFSRTFSSFSRRCSSSAIPLLFSRLSATALRSAVLSTTSLAVRS